VAPFIVAEASTVTVVVADSTVVEAVASTAVAAAVGPTVAVDTANRKPIWSSLIRLRSRD
jgi:hypothetical protein